MGISEDFHNFVSKASDLASSATTVGSQKMREFENTGTGIKAKEALEGVVKTSKEHLDHLQKSGIPDKFRNIALEKQSKITVSVKELEQSQLATKVKEQGLKVAGYGKGKFREFMESELREAVIENFKRFRAGTCKIFENGRAFRALWKLFREHPVREGSLVFFMIYPAFLWMPVLGILGWGIGGVISGSFAGKMQSRIGNVPSGSGFSILQSMGSGGNPVPSIVMNYFVRALIAVHWAFRARDWIYIAAS